MTNNNDSGDTGYGIFDNIDTQQEGDIFAKRELLQIDYVPNRDRIVGRDEQIETVATDIGPIIEGNPPNSIVIYGKPGCGKSLVAKHVSQAAEQEANNREFTIATAYVNCQQAKGNTGVLAEIGSKINQEGGPHSFPRRGISENEYYTRIWETLDMYYDGLLVVLDEVDKLKDDDILMALSRAGEDGSVNVPIGVIAVSNKIDFRDMMSERTKSSFGHNEIVFDPYDASQIHDILDNRTDAFVDDVLSEGVIARAAALSAQEHGDARKAMRLLRYAGDTAISAGDSIVREAHIDSARQSAQIDRLLELISGLPPHSKHLLIALAYKTKDADHKEWFRTGDIGTLYESVCESEAATPLTSDRRRQLLDELSFLEIAGSRRGVNQTRESPKEYKLLWDAETVLRLDE